MTRSAGTAVLALLLALAPPLQGQNTPGAPLLQLKRSTPAVEWGGCPAAPAVPAVSADVRAAAERLATESTEASILGDIAGALVLLDRAAEADPTSERVAYLRARTLELLGRGEEALREYCRYTALAPNGVESGEVQARISTLSLARGFAVPARAVEYHTAGVAHHDAGRMQEAYTAFDAAAAAAPDWGAAVFNRAVTRLALGERAAAARDLRTYLELNPGADDLATVLDVMQELQAAPVAPSLPNPVSALAAGLVVPGLGHFTTGRPRRGALFLAGAAGAVGIGLVASRSRVECLSPPVDGRCPPDQVLRETTSRPLMAPALIGALAAGIAGAVDAYLGVKRANERVQSGAPAAAPGGLSLGPDAVPAGTGTAHITFVRIRF